MIFRQISVGIMMFFLLWQGVAEASSISTRVRVLESKLAKQESQLKQVNNPNAKVQNTAVDRRLMATVKRLEKKVDDLLYPPIVVKSKQSKSEEISANNGYAFP